MVTVPKIAVLSSKRKAHLYNSFSLNVRILICNMNRKATGNKSNFLIFLKFIAT